MDVLRRALEVSPPDASTLAAWWEATTERMRWTTPIDRAVIGGALADRMGFAFAGGYHEALQALVPSLAGRAASLCATEEGGNHPRAIKTTLIDGVLTGKKAWATAASGDAILLVIATTGERDGKPQLVMASVRADAPGVKLTTTAAPFVPEIPHAMVELDRVTASEVFAGDGYDDYLKPFRTVEDLHVHGALFGYVLGVARRRGWSDLIPAISVAIAATRALAAEDPKAASTHLALAGLIEQMTRVVGEVETRWASAPDDEFTRWQRDRKILQIAGAARTARLTRAKERLS
jgi:hypothetical protein